MIPTPERKATKIKADVDDRIPTAVSLRSADEIMEYQPILAAEGLTTPLMIIAVEGDATTPTDHAERLYAAACGPKQLIMQRHTTHYAAYDRYWTQVTPRLVDWLDTYVRAASVLVHTAPSRLSEEIIIMDVPE
jgi:dipeptidyl aminopeptidase/acylaminoacyl peptidase